MDDLWSALSITDDTQNEEATGSLSRTLHTIVYRALPSPRGGRFARIWGALAHESFGEKTRRNEAERTLTKICHNYQADFTGNRILVRAALQEIAGIAGTVSVSRNTLPAVDTQPIPANVAEAICSYRLNYRHAVADSVPALLSVFI